jgi:hypothetical protein
MMMYQQPQDGYLYGTPDEYMEQEEEWEREGLLDPAWEKQQKKVSSKRRLVSMSSLYICGACSERLNRDSKIYRLLIVRTKISCESLVLVCVTSYGILLGVGRGGHATGCAKQFSMVYRDVAIRGALNSK